MGACEMKSPAGPTPHRGARQFDVFAEFSNPFAVDAPDDREFAITGRKLNRLVFLAAKAAERFSRTGMDLDPLIWMHLPSDHLEGRHPIDACMELRHFETAMVFEEPCSRSTLSMVDMDVSRCAGEEVGHRDAFTLTGENSPCFAGTRRLYTATIVDMVGCQYLHVFYAAVAKNIVQVSERLRQRFGRETADLAIIRPGFDPSDPIVLSLVSEALAEILVLVDAEPCSPLASGLNIQFEARFDA